MPDYPRMLHHIEEAQKHLKEGVDAMLPMKKLTQMESYVLAFMRAAQAVLDKAHDAVLKTRAVKEKPVPARKEGDSE